MSRGNTVGCDNIVKHTLMVTLLTVVLKYGGPVEYNVSLLSTVTLSDALRVNMQHISPCAWGSGRYLTLNSGPRITGVMLSFKANLSCPRLKTAVLY